jgi:hypothetical protein
MLLVMFIIIDGIIQTIRLQRIHASANEIAAASPNLNALSFMVETLVLGVCDHWLRLSVTAATAFAGIAGRFVTLSCWSSNRLRWIPRIIQRSYKSSGVRRAVHPYAAGAQIHLDSRYPRQLIQCCSDMFYTGSAGHALHVQFGSVHD